MKSSAVISDCSNYRYSLTRTFDTVTHKTPVLFVMLNPSTADHREDDPTIRRCISFAKAWGHRNLNVANLYAFRSTDPVGLKACSDPIGPLNDDYLANLLACHMDVVCAWGNNAEPERVNEFVYLAELIGARLWCLGTTKTNMPKHPLYIKADQPLISWNWDD